MRTLTIRIEPDTLAARARDGSAVHRDITALTERGLVEKDETGKLFVPFARIHAEIDLMSKAA